MNQKSPWIDALPERMVYTPADGDTDADVLIIGAGIAGTATAYELLATTDKSVTLIDAQRIAHGATGRNSGHITTYLERPLEAILEEFGLEITRDSLHEQESAWRHLEEIIAATQFTGNYTTNTLCETRFQGYEKFQHFIGRNRVLSLCGLLLEPLRVSAAAPWLSQITPEDQHYCEVTSELDIDSHPSQDGAYHAYQIEAEHLLNSAEFVEHVVTWLLNTYPDRFTVHEYTPVHTVYLGTYPRAIGQGFSITANQITLCTNGYTGIEFTTGEHTANLRSHIRRLEGYMAAQTTDNILKSGITCYMPNGIGLDNYWYTSARPYRAHKKTLTLCTVGGPDQWLDRDEPYFDDKPLQGDMVRSLAKFVNDLEIDEIPNDEFEYTWSGVMGYTPNMLRMIGPDPVHSNLYYNLGCNGVGLVPSILGAQRIAAHLANKPQKPSIFDVQESPLLGL